MSRLTSVNGKVDTPGTGRVECIHSCLRWITEARSKVDMRGSKKGVPFPNGFPFRN